MKINIKFSLINIVLIVLVIVIAYMMTFGKDMYKKEMISNVDKKSKECSQKSINHAYQYWVFGSPKYIR